MKLNLTKGSAFFLVLILFYISGCSTYPFQTKGAQNSFYSGDFAKAAQELELKSNEEGKDQLLYLLDRATALQLLGQYDESSKLFLKADKMSEVKDYVSLSTEAATLLINDNLKEYHGEDFEKVMINAYLAINYTMAHKYEDARVECRRVNEKLHRYKFEAKRDYEQNPFARYLSGLIWEASGRLDDAYIDYKMAYELIPSFGYLQADILRLAKRLNRDEDLKKYQEKIAQDIVIPTKKEEKETGEIILVYQQGRSAVKKPHPASPRFPKFFARPATTQSARLEVPTAENKTELTQKLYSVSDIAIKTLDDAYAGLVAKRVGGVVAKAVVADQIRQKNQILGDLAWIGMNIADQADLRHWATLPDSIQIAKLRLPPGDHTIKVVGLDGSNNPSGEEATFQVKVEARRKFFLNWRSIK